MADYGVIISKFPYVAVSGGRLTAVSGDPEGDASTAVSTIYYAPYIHDIIVLYDTVKRNWQPRQFAQLSFPLSGLAANTNFDIFLAINPAGSFFYKTTAWTNSSTRATAILQVDGIWVKSDEQNYRYLGSFRTAGTIGTLVDYWENRAIFNAENRIRRELYKAGSAPSTTYTYVTASSRVAGGNTANQIPFLIGQASNLTAQAFWLHAQSSSSYVNRFSIGLNTVGNAISPVGWYNNIQSTFVNWDAALVQTFHNRIKTIGYNQLIPVELGSGATTPASPAYASIRYQDMRGSIDA